MATGFWLNEAGGGNRGISGIIHVLRIGRRWQYCPSVHGPPMTIYDLFLPLDRPRVTRADLYERPIARHI
jgi:hypothetical protein